MFGLVVVFELLGGHGWVSCCEDDDGVFHDEGDGRVSSGEG